MIFIRKIIVSHRVTRYSLFTKTFWCCTGQERTRISRDVQRFFLCVRNRMTFWVIVSDTLYKWFLHHTSPWSYCICLWNPFITNSCKDLRWKKHADTILRQRDIIFLQHSIAHYFTLLKPYVRSQFDDCRISNQDLALLFHLWHCKNMKLRIFIYTYLSMLFFVKAIGWYF